VDATLVELQVDFDVTKDNGGLASDDSIIW
jgi:hypothetical protein